MGASRLSYAMAVAISASGDEVKSATGDFYVSEGCCTSCGVPQVVAPDLVGWADEMLSHGYWIKQPANAEELNQAVKLLHSQELGCHRYSGNDPAILKRLPPEECDFLHPDRVWNKQASLGPSDVPFRFSLSASEGGFLTRLWRRISQSNAHERNEKLVK